MGVAPGEWGGLPVTPPPMGLRSHRSLPSRLLTLASAPFPLFPEPYRPAPSSVISGPTAFPLIHPTPAGWPWLELN